MTSIGLCVLAFVAVTMAARRSITAGLITVLTVGYVYGITRANVPEPAAHFMLDAAVVALYLQYFRRPSDPLAPSAPGLDRWAFLLIGWPVLMFVVPLQDWLIQVVGLRANILLLPLMLIGARLTPAERFRLAVGTAALNLLAFGVAVAEYFNGVELFFPPGPVTRIIYSSRDVAGGEYRIPSTFTSAHAYAGAMVVSLPLLFGAWMQLATRWRRHLMSAAIAATLLGVFMAAARVHIVAAFVLVTTAMLSVGSKRNHRVAWLVVLLTVAWTVSAEERLQRFTTLSDTEALAERLQGSINVTFLEAMTRYPLGDGLGSGSSIPYFLEDRLPELFAIENEYGRIVLELGIPGLLLWIAFLLWAASRSAKAEEPSWRPARRLARVSCGTSFALAILGTGLFTSIPSTCLLLLNLGWIVAGEREPGPEPLEGKAAMTRVPRGQPS